MTETAATPPISGRTVLVAGATSAAGVAATRALVGAGARVIATGRAADRLVPLAELGARTDVCDLTDESAAGRLAAALEDDGVRIDGILHLVGGWRGGGGIAGQTEADYRFLEQSFTALRHVTRAFWDHMVHSPEARLAVVSSTAVSRPLAGGANYAAVKAATEAWTRATAHGFAKAARDADSALHGAAVVYRVTELAGREELLARSFVGLWNTAAAEINDTTIDLSAS